MIIPVGTWQMVWMSLISMCELISYLVMSCSEGAAKVWEPPLGREGPRWTAGLGAHGCQGRKALGPKAGLAAMRATCLESALPSPDVEC